jgi:hypothetical protein
MNAETVYGDDPVAMGQRWVSQAAVSASSISTAR